MTKEELNNLTRGSIIKHKSGHKYVLVGWDWGKPIFIEITWEIDLNQLNDFEIISKKGLK